jgi:hypothetical protein
MDFRVVGHVPLLTPEGGSKKWILGWTKYHPQALLVATPEVALATFGGGSPLAATPQHPFSLFFFLK